MTQLGSLGQEAGGKMEIGQEEGRTEGGRAGARQGRKAVGQEGGRREGGRTGGRQGRRKEGLLPVS